MIQRAKLLLLAGPFTTLRRLAPALGLFFLSPLVAEFLLGNISISAFPVVLFLAPMYGGGAILVREVARRHWRGWRTMFLLGLAYGLIEEGLIIQTLFNPSYFGLDLLRETHITALGMGAWWTLFVLTLHTVWSISVPIAIIEPFFPDRMTTPWLGKMGLSTTSVLFTLGAITVFYSTYNQERFLASTRQLIGTAVTIAVVVFLAFVGTRPRTQLKQKAPRPWQVGTCSFLAASTFMAARWFLADWSLVVVYILLFVVVAVAVVRFSGRNGWGAAHGLALAGGALLTYAWYAFPAIPLIGTRGSVDLIGNVVFALGAVILLVAAFRSLHRARRSV